MNTLVLYDDAIAREFEPFALTRPVAELRAGTEVIRRRWEKALTATACGFVGAAHLDAFEELDAPPTANGEIAAGTIVANSRCAVRLAAAADSERVWTCRGRVAAVRLENAISAAELRSGAVALDALVPSTAAAREVDGWWIDEVWDLIRFLPEMIADDITHRVGALDTIGADAAGAAIIGAHPARVEHGATIDPYVVFDASAMSSWFSTSSMSCGMW